jgi:predicted nucleotidyltransferase
MNTGSHLYGTNTPTSDIDICGIVMPSIEEVYGFEKMEEFDLSITDKDSSGKNTKDAVDIKYYEFRKFVKLAMENNPKTQQRTVQIIRNPKIADNLKDAK